MLKGFHDAGLLRKKAMAAGHVTMEATLPAQQNSQERETVVRLQQVWETAGSLVPIPAMPAPGYALEMAVKY